MGAQIHWIRPCTRVWLLLNALSCVTYLVGASAIDALWLIVPGALITTAFVLAARGGG